MSNRYRKVIKLAQGLVLTRPGSGVAWRLGPKGVNVDIGKRYVPPSPDSAKARAAARAKPAAAATPGRPPRATDIQLNVDVTDAGIVVFKDNAGKPLPADWTETAKRIMANEVRILMQKKCDDINRQIEALGEIHIYSPAPDAAPSFDIVPFNLPRPKVPVLKSRGFLGLIFKSVARKIDAENAHTTSLYETAKAEWESTRIAHEARQESNRQSFERALEGEPAAMERIYETKLAEIVWPCEIVISMDITQMGSELRMDVRVPELEEMPTSFAAMPLKGYQLDTREMPKSQVRWIYMRLVHAIGFRLMGEAFANMVAVNRILLHAYTQSKNPTTGDTLDKYIYSVAVRRHQWKKLPFSTIRSVDVFMVFNQFNMRRTMGKTGVFTPIEPLDSFPDLEEAGSASA